MLFDLLGDREAADFFAKMSVAAYDERERGHTGNFFNILWAMPGVSRCGPHASGAYWREQAWYYDLARGWDGSFRYQGSPVGEEEHGKYTNWDNTGTYLLAYALPLKKLRITGKGPVFGDTAFATGGGRCHRRRTRVFRNQGKRPATLLETQRKGIVGRFVELVARGPQALGAGTRPPRWRLPARRVETSNILRHQHPLRRGRGARLPGSQGGCRRTALARTAQGPGPVDARPCRHLPGRARRGGTEKIPARPARHDGHAASRRPARHGATRRRRSAVLAHAEAS